MNLVEELQTRLQDPSLTKAEQALLRCELARTHLLRGENDAAREVLGGFWRGAGVRPDTAGLDRVAGAALLFCAGALTGRLGGGSQATVAQEASKDLLGESLRELEALGVSDFAAAAEIELGYCYWREGAYDEARAVLSSALAKLPDDSVDYRCLALLRLAVTESSSTRVREALRILTGAARLFERCGVPFLRGCFHLELGTALQFLGESERAAESTDRALIEYAAAAVLFEEVGNQRYLAMTENNLGYLFSNLGRTGEAHAHLDRARSLFRAIGADLHIAQVDETRARTFLREGRNSEAAKASADAVAVLERGDARALLAEALVTRGAALARLGRPAEAHDAFGRAISVGESAGDLEGAGVAALTVLEELGDDMPFDAFFGLYERADALLARSERPEIGRRLRACAMRALRSANTQLAARKSDEVATSTKSPARPAPNSEVDARPHSWEGFDLERAVRSYEAGLIRQALDECGGEVTAAAKLLNILHQTLIWKIKNQMPELQGARKPVRPRRRGIIPKEVHEREKVRMKKHQ